MNGVRVPPPRELSQTRRLQRKEHLLTELARMAGWGAPPRRGGATPPRRWLTVAFAAAAVLTLGGATFALVTHKAEHVVGGVVCYAEASPNSDAAIVGADGRHPVEVCADLWARGDVGPRIPATEVPPLVACVPDRGQVVWVYPGGPGTCGDLGLAPLPSGYREVAKRFAAVQRELQRQIPDTRCVEEDDARAIARRVLDEHGFRSWTVEEAPSGFSEAAPCAGLYYDPVRKVVMLVPEEPRGT